jgi:hypothetical protein
MGLAYMAFIVSRYILSTPNFVYCCAGWGYIVAFTKVLTVYQIYHAQVHSLHLSPLLFPPPIPGMVSAGIIFAFTYICTQFLYHIHSPTPLSLPWAHPPSC